MFHSAECLRIRPPEGQGKGMGNCLFHCCLACDAKQGRTLIYSLNQINQHQVLRHVNIIGNVYLTFQCLSLTFVSVSFERGIIISNVFPTFHPFPHSTNLGEIKRSLLDLFLTLDSLRKECKSERLILLNGIRFIV